MRTRSALAVLAVIALIGAPAAGATVKKKKPAPKPKVYCNLLVDQTTDDAAWDANPLVTSPGLDIKTGDVVTGLKTMTAVLRLGSVDFKPTTDKWAVLGYDWSISANSTLGQSYAFKAVLEYDGSIKATVTVDGAKVDSNFSIDPKTNSFKWVVQRKDVPMLSRPHNVFKEFRGQSRVSSSTADDAPAMPVSVTYPDRGLSCVHPA
jgi:hypothetical protein